MCTDIYVSGLLLIDVLFLSYPSPYFIAFCPQPKAIMMILLCWCLSREKKRYFGRFYDEGKELKFREVGGIKMSCGSDRAEFVDSTAQKPVLQWFYRII